MARERGRNSLRSSAKALNSSNVILMSLRCSSLSNSSTRSSILFMWLMSADATKDKAKSLADMVPREL